MNNDAADDLKPYPDPKANQAQKVIRLPELENEIDHKIELIFGKTARLDSVNRYFLTGEFTARIAEGWGYPYYEFTSSGEVGGTLMAVPPDAPRVDRFVSANGIELIRYNSKLPVVVYLPRDIELRYRIWSAGEEKTPQ